MSVYVCVHVCVRVSVCECVCVCAKDLPVLTGTYRALIFIVSGGSRGGIGGQFPPRVAK